MAHRETSVPAEFAELRGSVQHVMRKSQREFSSSCPECGGSVHPDGSLPDRFLMWTSSRIGKPLGWCRRCGYKWWPGKESGSELSPEERQRWIEERQQEEQAAREAAERRYQNALGLLRTERAWERYHEQLTEQSRALWRARGIPDLWQDMWQLGYCPNFRVWVEQEQREHFTSTLAIPIFEEQWKPVSLRHRLLFPPTAGDRYRPEMSGLAPAAFMADPDQGWQLPKVLILEGEIKSAVAYLELDDPQMQVLGVPGKNVWENLLPKLAGKQVWLCFDPDAHRQALEMAQLISAAECVRIMTIPNKIDDAILAGWLDKPALKRLVHSARKVK